MIALLKSDSLARPQRLVAPPAQDDPKLGLLTPGFGEGSALLRSQEGAYYRLAWKKEDKDRRRALPPGEYALTNYVVIRRDDEGKEWFVSATGRAIRKIVIQAGEEQKLALPESIQVVCRAVSQKSEVQVQGVLQGENHSGLSLYREGRRITIGYRLADGQGKELAAGALDYG